MGLRPFEEYSTYVDLSVKQELTKTGDPGENLENDEYHHTPLYLSSLVPQSVSNLSRYNLRNSNDLQTIDARTYQYDNSFFLPSSVRE